MEPMQNLTVFRPTEALELARSSASMVDFSPFVEQPCFLLELEAGFAQSETEEITRWFKRLPCPVIGLAGSECNDALTQACDVRLAELREAEPLLRTIKRCPTAAAVLVQVLRITENMPLDDALDVESMAYATLQGGAEYQAWLDANRSPQPFAPTDNGPAVLLERNGDTVTLALNRASNRNAMSVEMRDALNEALQMVLLDESVRSVEISGHGRCFSVGGDLTEFGSVPDAATGHIVRSISLPGRLLARCAEKTIVKLHGACIGSGMEFPAFAQRVIAAKNTHFQLPEVGMGLIPGAGGCISIARRMGRQRAAWLALSGKRIRAYQALEWGLVDALAD